MNGVPKDLEKDCQKGGWVVKSPTDRGRPGGKKIVYGLFY